ncbi:MAG: IS3 family transposase, partial [Thermoleophilia bacterium]|nr:IS3 family transposase [Thermoleophilia bacterium]
MVVELIDSHKHRFGVVPVCRVLCGHGVGIAPSSYYAYKSRPASVRALRDVELLAEIKHVYFGPGRGKYGARKVRRQLKAEGHQVAKCAVERLMRQAG